MLEIDAAHKRTFRDLFKNEAVWDAFAALFSARRESGTSALQSVDPKDAVAVAKAQERVGFCDSVMEEFDGFRKFQE